MRIHIEIVTEGQPGRQRVATVERIVDQAACDGIGLSLEEVKRLIGQLQTIVSAEQSARDGGGQLLLRGVRSSLNTVFSNSGMSLE